MSSASKKPVMTAAAAAAAAAAGAGAGALPKKAPLQPPMSLRPPPPSVRPINPPAAAAAAPAAAAIPSIVGDDADEALDRALAAAPETDNKVSPSKRIRTAPGSSPASNAVWICSACTAVNSGSVIVCDKCKRGRATPKQWKCGSCNSLNAQHDEKCTGCKQPKQKYSADEKEMKRQADEYDEDFGSGGESKRKGVVATKYASHTLERDAKAAGFSVDGELKTDPIERDVEDGGGDADADAYVHVPRSASLDSKSSGSAAAAAAAAAADPRKSAFATAAAAIAESVDRSKAAEGEAYAPGGAAADDSIEHPVDDDDARVNCNSVYEQNDPMHFKNFRVHPTDPTQRDIEFEWKPWKTGAPQSLHIKITKTLNNDGKTPDPRYKNHPQYITGPFGQLGHLTNAWPGGDYVPTSKVKSKEAKFEKHDLKGAKHTWHFLITAWHRKRRDVHGCDPDVAEFREWINVFEQQYAHFAVFHIENAIVSYATKLAEMSTPKGIFDLTDQHRKTQQLPRLTEAEKREMVIENLLHFGFKHVFTSEIEGCKITDYVTSDFPTKIGAHHGLETNALVQEMLKHKVYLNVKPLYDGNHKDIPWKDRLTMGAGEVMSFQIRFAPYKRPNSNEFGLSLMYHTATRLCRVQPASGRGGDGRSTMPPIPGAESAPKLLMAPESYFAKSEADEMQMVARIRAVGAAYKTEKKFSLDGGKVVDPDAAAAAGAGGGGGGGGGSGYARLPAPPAAAAAAAAARKPANASAAGAGAGSRDFPTGYSVQID